MVQLTNNSTIEEIKILIYKDLNNKGFEFKLESKMYIRIKKPIKVKSYFDNY